MAKTFKFVYLNKHFTYYQNYEIRVFSVAKDSNNAVYIFDGIPYVGKKHWLINEDRYLPAYPVFKIKTEEDKLFNEINWKDSLRFYAIVDDEVKEINAEIFKMMRFVSNG